MRCNLNIEQYKVAVDRISFATTQFSPGSGLDFILPSTIFALVFPHRSLIYKSRASVNEIKVKYLDGTYVLHQIGGKITAVDFENKSGIGNYHP